jgi:citrate lyase subunit beta/citryl-CoA lyase
LPYGKNSAKHNRMTAPTILPPRSALYLPASNPRAIEKARMLPADMIILDLEDAVPPDKKDEARDAAVVAMATGFGNRMTAIRVNGAGSLEYAADASAIAGSMAGYAVVPKIDTPEQAAAVAKAVGKPLFVMIETPRGVLNASAIAAVPGICGLIAGMNDLASELRLPMGSGRAGLSLALQTIVLAARAAGIWALDGVFNGLSDREGLEAECREGRSFGFDGKTLIHPSQIDSTNRIWSPGGAEVAEAEELIAASRGGAQRFKGRMIETMHVEQAKMTIERFQRAMGGD